MSTKLNIMSMIVLQYHL